jgi:hypothetical protein
MFLFWWSEELGATEFTPPSKKMSFVNTSIGRASLVDLIASRQLWLYPQGLQLLNSFVSRPGPMLESGPFVPLAEDFE